MTRAASAERARSLLLACVDPRVLEVPFDDGAEEVDWSVFLDAAFRHRVAALAGRSLTRGQWFEPDSRREYVHDALTAAHALNERRNSVLVAEACRIVGILREAGLARIALRKGAFLAPAVYRDIGLRPMNDIDLFVAREDALRVANVLKLEGFTPGYVDARGAITPLSRAQSVFWNVHVNTLPTFHRPAPDPVLRSIAVDVCFGLFLPASGCHLDAEVLLGEVRTFKVEADDLPVFRPEHLLVDVAVHLHKESTTLRYIERGKHQRLLQYVDIAAIATTTPDLDWDVVVRTAESANASANVYFALANTEELFPLTIPASVLTHLSTDAGVGAAFLREYGAIDLPQPLSWSATGIAARLFSDERPAATSQSPV